MTMILVAAVAVLAVALVIALALLMRGHSRADESEQFELLSERIDAAADAQSHAYERLERQLRNDITETARVSRTEQSSGFAQFQQTLASQFSSMTTVQGGKIDGFAQQLDAVRHSLQQQAQQARDEQGRTLKQFGETLTLQLGQLTEANDRRFAEVRATIEQRLKDIEANNSTKLDEMRRTVDEKLHATLEQRLGESFKLVSDRLEQVHRGLGEMQTLAAGVGDLKKVLTNVKTRGTWGEVQLEALLEQLLTADQYAKNVATVPKSADRVEFAIKLPGRAEAGGPATPVWLPIDAKFPREDSGTRRSGCGGGGVARARSADSRRGTHDCGEVRVAAAYHRFRAAVSADRRSVRGSAASPGPDGHAATRLPRDDCRPDHAHRLA
jgi:DNA recombination protein RmuC